MEHHSLERLRAVPLQGIKGRGKTECAKTGLEQILLIALPYKYAVFPCISVSSDQYGNEMLKVLFEYYL